jgi:hypothetical protein
MLIKIRTTEEVFMLNQHVIREKLLGLWGKFRHKPEKSNSDEAEVMDDPSMYEFVPDDQVSTSPRSRVPLSDGTTDAQDLVWDNEDGSMQDKSYSFDEVTTDADYDTEDGLDFADEDKPEGSESRYR